VTCPYCQTSTEDDAAYCPSCGRAVGPQATVAADAPTAAGAHRAGQRGGGSPSGLGPPAWDPRPTAGQTRSPGSDAVTAFVARTSVRTWVLAGATLLTFIAMFLPWYSASALGITFTEDGFHRWGWLTFVGFLAAAAVTAFAFLGDRGPLAAHQLPKAIVAVGVVEAAGAVAAWIDVVVNSGGAGPSVGLFLALIAGLATAGFVIWERSRSRTAAGSRGGAPGQSGW
jgi:hypothetical protein